MDLQLSGKMALVTGASRGIGRAVAEGLAQEGVSLHLAARTAGDLNAAADDIRKRWNVGVVTHAVDLGTSDGVDGLARECRGVDIVVNNAGAVPSGRLTDIDEARWRESWELKLFGYINLTRHIYSAMIERKAGVILNVIGNAANNPRPNFIAGSAVNAALDAFTVALGRESQAHGVRVLGVHPSGTATPRQEARLAPLAKEKLGDAARWRELMGPQPFGRPTEPSEVADMVVFLVSERARHTSGVMVTINDGI